MLPLSKDITRKGPRRSGGSSTGRRGPSKEWNTGRKGPRRSGGLRSERNLEKLSTGSKPRFRETTGPLTKAIQTKVHAAALD